MQDVFDLVFLDAEKDDYERLFALAREKVEPGALIVADNVLSHAETLAAYSAARQADPSLVSTTVPLDRGLRALRCPPLGPLSSRLTRKGGGPDSERFKYGQRRYQRVGTRPRDLRGTA